MPKLKVTHFTVQGFGVFPVDMLRYDQCWPERTEDAIQITKRPSEYPPVPPPMVRLVTHGVKITNDRWSSFGWTVISERTAAY